MPWSLIPLLHACVFGLVAVMARVILVRYRTGASPLAFDGANSAREFTARCFYVWLPLMDFVFLLSYALSHDPGPPLLQGLLQSEAIRWTGTALLAVSLVWVVLSQAAMGNDWKMGVDDDAAFQLRTDGPFAYSRHPVYLGVRLTIFAQLLVIGSWPMLTLWVASELLVQVQARFEEEAMETRYGNRYLDYCKKVRRWL
jgi:protein-S-isoprenylcysteine O-methyltransferase Ste14